MEKPSSHQPAIRQEPQQNLGRDLLLKERNDWIQTQLFGTRSDRFASITQEQQTLFSCEVGASNGYEVTVTPILNPAHKQQLHKRSTAPKGHGWGFIPEHLERVDIHFPLSDEQKKRQRKRFGSNPGIDH